MSSGPVMMRDLAMAELDQVPRRGVGAAPVRGADRRDVRSRLPGGIQHDEGDVACAELPFLHLEQVADDQDDPDRAAVENPLDPVQVRLLAVVRARDHHAHAMLTSQPLDRRDGLGSP